MKAASAAMSSGFPNRSAGWKACSCDIGGGPLVAIRSVVVF
jgi:hypothetical protein